MEYQLGIFQTSGMVRYGWLKKCQEQTPLVGRCGCI